MKLLTVNYPKTEKDEQKIEFLIHNYDANVKPLLKKQSDRLQLPPLQNTTDPLHRVGMGLQLKQLLYRDAVSQFRDPQ